MIMTKSEIKKALSLLGDRVDRHDAAGIDGGGWCMTVFWRDGGQRLFHSLEEVESWLDSKPKTGRPAPLGRKVPVGIRLTPDVLEFCKQHPDGFVFLETLCRNSKEFKAWVKSNPDR
jgi:hypothetical protein